MMQEGCEQGGCIVFVSSLGAGATAGIGLICSTAVSRFVFGLDSKGEVWAYVRVLLTGSPAYRPTQACRGGGHPVLLWAGL